VLRRRESRRFADVVRSSVVLHLTTGESIAGVLLGDYADVYCLARTRILAETTGRVVPIDGEVLVPKERVKYAQVGVSIDDTRDLSLAPVAESRQ
jgi:hypothetical protein